MKGTKMIGWAAWAYIFFEYILPLAWKAVLIGGTIYFVRNPEQIEPAVEFVIGRDVDLEDTTDKIFGLVGNPRGSNVVRR